MRRYADVVVHRLLAGIPVDDLEGQVDHMNQRARLVRALQDMYERWKVTRHLATLAESPPVYATGIHRAGVQWFMPSMSLNGFSHVSTLEPKQYWALRSPPGQLDYLQGAVSVLRVGDVCAAAVTHIDPVTCAVQLRMRVTDPGGI